MAGTRRCWRGRLASVSLFLGGATFFFLLWGLSIILHVVAERGNKQGPPRAEIALATPLILPLSFSAVAWSGQQPLEKCGHWVSHTLRLSITLDWVSKYLCKGLSWLILSPVCTNYGRESWTAATIVPCHSPAQCIQITQCTRVTELMHIPVQINYI